METANNNNNMEEDIGGAFERSINSKLSDWTSVFDPSVEVEPYKFCWSPSELSPGSKSPTGGQQGVCLDESAILEKVANARATIADIFEENCASLDRDIQRSYENWDIGQEVYINDLLEREALIRAYADQLTELAPEMAEMIGLKLSALSRSLEQLRLKHESDAKIGGYPERSAAVHLRKWLQATEQKLGQIKHDISLYSGVLPELQRLRAALQAIQLEIETEGRQLIRVAKRYFTRKALEWNADPRKIDRLQRNLEVLETRWYNVYLAGVEGIEQVNNFIHSLASGDESGGSDIESICSSEPVRKRRRRSIDHGGDWPDILPTRSPKRNPSNANSLRAESEEDGEDIIPFGASEYESLMTNENQRSDVEEQVTPRDCRNVMVSTSDMNTLLDKPSPSGFEKRTSSTEDGWSSSKTQDIGYSSGENSVHEALNSIGSDSPISPPAEVTEATLVEDREELQRMRTKNSPVNSYYRTVPLDDFGTTDTETPRFIPTLNLDLTVDESDQSQKVLDGVFSVCASDDEIPSDPHANVDILDRNYKEVMKMMDENLASGGLRMGTSWKELKTSGLNARRLSATPSKWSSASKVQNRRSLPVANGKMSCDASSEDSDYATNSSKLSTQMSVSFNACSNLLLTVPSTNFHSQPQMLQRKRRHQRQTPNSVGTSTPKMTTTSLNNSASILKNVAMDQSVYIPQDFQHEEQDFQHEEQDQMSQSLNLPSGGAGRSGKRRFLRRRMRRTASDNTDLGFYVGGLVPQVLPLYASSKNQAVERRNSMESNSSSSTFHESSDAHFEWDEYRDDTLVEDVTMAPSTEIMNGIHHHSTTPILTPPDVDENFETELPFVDMSVGIGAFLAQSRDSLEESYRLLQSQGNQEALKLNAVSVGRTASENLRRIRAIMQSSSTLEIRKDARILQDAWLKLLHEHKIPSDDTMNATQVNDVMLFFQEIEGLYRLFVGTCNEPDSDFLSKASLNELNQKLQLRKSTFKELQALYEKVKDAVSHFLELQPELERVNANLNVIGRYVANLERFSDIRNLNATIANLQVRLRDTTDAINRLSRDAATPDHAYSHKLRAQIHKLDADLTDCQQRMSSLETVCNKIIAQMEQKDSKGNLDSDEYVCMEKFVNQYHQSQEQLAGMKTSFDELTHKCPDDILRRPNSQLNDDSYDSSDSNSNKFSTSSMSKLRRRRRNSSDKGSTQVFEATTDTPAANGIASTSSIDSASFNGGVASRMSMYAPPIKTILSCILLISMGLFLLYIASDKEVFSRSGHWRFKFGPQLRYVNGPPPV